MIFSQRNDNDNENANANAFFFGSEGSDEELKTDSMIDDWIFKKVQTGHHVSGTCRMGNSSLNSVVDSQGRVHGTNSLRVCDASIMPRLIRAKASGL